MKKLFIASNNAHKIEEIRDILKRNNIEIELLCPKDFNDICEPVEDGSTFEENAYIKAKYYYDLHHLNHGPLPFHLLMKLKLKNGQLQYSHKLIH